MKRKRNRRQIGVILSWAELSRVGIWPNGGTISLAPCHWCGSPYRHGDSGTHHSHHCPQAFVAYMGVEIDPPCQLELYEAE